MSNHAEMAPMSVPGASWAPSGARRSPKSAPKPPERDPKTAPGRPSGHQRAPRRRPKALLGGLGGGKIATKSGAEVKKVDSSKSAPRLAPADARSTLDPFKPPQNRCKMVQNAFLSRLGVLFGQIWSLKSGLDALGDRFGSTPNP